MSPKIHYTITPYHPEAHMFRVTCTVSDPDPTGQRFSLPAWIPGSYMVRDFARNIVTIQAEAGGKPVRLTKLDKHTWQAAAMPAGRTLTVRCEIYAWDLSVRAAHLDQTHGFFNGTSVFLAVEGQTDQPCSVAISPPEGAAYAQWRLATAMTPAETKNAVDGNGFGTYVAADYDELIDHPVEMGTFTRATFEAEGIPHEIILTGRHDCDLERLCADLKKICTWQLRLFGKPAPIKRYLFMAMIVGKGYGGLEHRASTALLANRKDLPYPGMRGMNANYRRFLGLCSHEYFHTWHVKRIKPDAFTPYDLSQENYTRLLWVFEGFTAYYDDLTLLRSGVISANDYLELLSETMSRVLRGAGRLKQSVAESSFDAWTKFYKQDENAPNAIVSYYAKGALIALALDLQLRDLSRGKRGLDEVMRLLWQRHGQTGKGVTERAVLDIVADVAGAVIPEEGRRLAEWLKRTVHSTTDLALPRMLRPFGVQCRADPIMKRPALGLRLAADANEARVANVHDGGPAQAAGVSAGDILIAIDGLRVDDGATLDAMLERRKPGDKMAVHAFRRDELMRFDLELAAPPAHKMQLSLQEKPQPSVRTLRKSWLGIS